jgi:hypothetical protein
MSRTIPASALIGIALLWCRGARGQDRFVDDESVQLRGHVRVAAGLGGALQTYAGPANGTLAIFGTGVNAEAAVGLGRSFEIGVRVGVRTDDAGRGLRADEVARAYGTVTFGTGVNTLANPELRLRWRAVRWGRAEVGLENRVVVPTGADPNVTEVLAGWVSIHVPRVARADLGLEGAFSWQSFETGYLLMPALAVPIRLWVNPTRGLFSGLVATTSYYAPTRYTTSDVLITTGLVGGYRIGRCDAILGAYLLDVVNDGIDRTGIGLGLACRFDMTRGHGLTAAEPRAPS